MHALWARLSTGEGKGWGDGSNGLGWRRRSGGAKMQRLHGARVGYRECVGCQGGEIKATEGGMKVGSRRDRWGGRGGSSDWRTVSSVCLHTGHTDSRPSNAEGARRWGRRLPSNAAPAHVVAGGAALLPGGCIRRGRRSRRSTPPPAAPTSAARARPPPPACSAAPPAQRRPVAAVRPLVAHRLEGSTTAGAAWTRSPDLRAGRPLAGV